MGEIDDALVAFIDILGFADEVLLVKDKIAFEATLAKVNMLHKYFELHPNSDLVLQAHETMSRRVLSLSDAVLVSIGYSSAFAESTPRLDLEAGVLSDLALAQANCVVNGVFLRGGVGSGFFYSEEDVLLSDALVRAYKVENTACMPVIALDPSFYKRFVDDPDNAAYAEEIRPAKQLIRSFLHPKNGDTIYYLDYFTIAVAAQSTFESDADIAAYREANSSAEKQKIINRSYLANEERFVEAHAASIREELAKPHENCVRQKYEWLAKYHNESVETHNYSEKYRI